MHISLDSALGQQRRLNQVGETISSIAAPAAAYSLRSLTGGDPKVVRVRRESDNTERDFTASGVSSGAMVNFVNAQTIKPLDVRALESDGDRDGDFQIASAAYSLRSLGDRQATVAATGDTVTAANGKYVVQVRRSSDDTIKSFVADEVTDGTLLAFVNEDVNGVFQNSGFESFSNASATGFTASNTGSTGFAVSDLLDGTSGTAISVSFDISITNGSPSISLRTALDGGSSASNSVNYTSSGSKTATLTASSNYVGIGFTEGDAPSNFTVSNFKILSDGLVRTWYDQSVTDQGGGTATGNHAVQTATASQPKIVSSGALVSGGLDFDGTNDFLPIPLTGHNIGNLSSFCVGKFDSASGNSDVMLSLGTSTGNSRWYAPFGSSSNIRYGYGSASDAIANFSASTDVKIHTIIAGTTIGNASGFENGTLKGTATRVTTTSAGTIGIGGINAVTDFPLDGKVQEVIVYESDQSANRGAYEGNIADHYNISGIPTEDNTVNGFVETWYDQSGNGKDATQTTASNQPKIVSSGSLLADGIEFDGSSDELETGANISGSAISGFVVANLDGTGANSLYSVGNTKPNVLFGNPSLAYVLNGGSALSGGTAPTNTDTLFTQLFISGGTSKTFIDGSAISSGDAGSNTASSDKLTIGNLEAIDRFMDGSIKELIIYNSDQTANRTALETNINSHYSLF
jgi:hypothetical protein